MQTPRASITAVGIVVGMTGMLGMALASPALYRLFCSATGYGGTPQTSLAQPGHADRARFIKVRFDAEIAPGLPWAFQPDQASVEVPLGQERIAFYRAQNEGGKALAGIAVYNLTPERVGRYFHKTACFCFNEQVLAPGQKQQFPVTFWVDPQIARDPDTKDVRTITLSYTFFHSLNDARSAGALAKAGPHVGPLRPDGSQ